MRVLLYFIYLWCNSFGHLPNQNLDLNKKGKKGHDKAGCRNKSKRSQINAIYFFIKVIGRGADEVAELAVQHYGLPYTGAEYLR